MNDHKGTIQDLSFYSHILSEELSLLIYLPHHYSTLYKYSLCIAQDGKDYFQLGRLARTMDGLIQNGEIENTIVVGIPYKNVEDRRNKYHPTGRQNEDYIRFLAHELIPYLEKEFPVYHVGSCRALAGDSLGATVSLMAALKYPHTFGKVIMHSPFVNEEVLNEVKNFQQPDLLSIYHVIGTRETEVKMTNGQTANFLLPNRELHETMRAVKIPNFYDEFDGDHTWKYWQLDLPRAFKYMFGK